MKTIQLNKIEVLLNDLANAVKEAEVTIAEEFKALEAKAALVRKHNPEVVFPWEMGVQTVFRPLPDQRCYQVKNSKDAVLKVLPKSKGTAITATEVVKRCQDLGLSYSSATIHQTLSKLKNDGLDAGETYRDDNGFFLNWTEGKKPAHSSIRHKGRPSARFYKSN